MPIFTSVSLIENRPFLRVYAQEEEPGILDKLRSFPEAAFHASDGWLLPYQTHLYEALTRAFPELNIVLLPQKNVDPAPNSDVQREPASTSDTGHPGEDALLQLTEHLMIRDYSHRTIKAYRSHFRAFMAYMAEKPLRYASKKDIRDYLSHQTQSLNWSEATVNQSISAIKCYFGYVLGQENSLSGLRPQVPQHLPEILQEKEVERFLLSIENLKHRAILSLIYATGIRLSESVNIRQEDLLPDQGLILIKAGKGRKDRYVNVPASLFDLLHQYIQASKPKYWLFEGIYDERYSPRTVQTIFRQAILLSQSNPYSTVQTLRHSCAIHLLRQGVSLVQVQELLGHASLKSTERYRLFQQHDCFPVRIPLNSLSAANEPGIRYVA